MKKSEMIAMIEYAKEAPDIGQMQSILWDALHGCCGAQNQKEIHQKYGSWKDYNQLRHVDRRTDFGG